jgi:hypothetical protein
LTGIAPNDDGSLIARIEPPHQLWRGHCLDFAGNAYNDTGGVTRFTPVLDLRGRSLAYLYAGENQDVAIAESVLHDVIPADPAPTVSAVRVESFALSELVLTRELELVDLTGYGLTRVHETMSSLIDTPPTSYGRTAAVAKRLIDATPTADGLLYPSRPFATGWCVVVYRRGRRGAPFRRVNTVALGAGPGRSIVDRSCHAAGVTIVR